MRTTYKIANYGARLFVIDEIKKEARLYDVADCRKILKEWEPTKLIEKKPLNDEWMDKAIKLWEGCGSITKQLEE